MGLPLDSSIKNDLALTAISFALMLPATDGKLLADLVPVYRGVPYFGFPISLLIVGNANGRLAIEITKTK